MLSSPGSTPLALPLLFLLHNTRTLSPHPHPPLQRSWISMRWLQQLENSGGHYGSSHTGEKKREEQKADETELTGNICSQCLPPSGREFAPHTGWSALTSLLFSSPFRMHWGLSAWPVSRGVRCGRLEGVEFTALQQHDKKNYFSGNTLWNNVSVSLRKENGRDVWNSQTDRCRRNGGKLLSSVWICLLAR